MKCEDICQQLAELIPDFAVFSKPWQLLEYFRFSELPVNLPLDWNYTTEPQHPHRTDVYVGRNVEIQPYCLFSGRVILDDGARIGPYSFIRGPVYIGKNAKIGPHCEIIRTIVMNDTCLAHKNSIADSILCERINFSGLSTGCNFPIGKDVVKVHYDGEVFDYKGKYGVYIDSDVNCGCLTITMPGCYIPAGSNIVGQCTVSKFGKVRSMVINKEVDAKIQS